MQAISELANLDDHHPDVDLRYDGVTVRLITITDDYWGLATRDLELVRQISAVAREHGVPADPPTVQNMVIAFDALVIPEVLPLWRAVGTATSPAPTLPRKS